MPYILNPGPDSIQVPSRGGWFNLPGGSRIHTDWPICRFCMEEVGMQHGEICRQVGRTGRVRMRDVANAVMFPTVPDVETEEIGGLAEPAR